MSEDTFWFMSYVCISSDQVKVTYGSCTYSGDEKPWEKVLRWNEQMDHQTFVLLSFQQCRGTDPSLDVEAGFFVN